VSAISSGLSRFSLELTSARFSSASLPLAASVALIKLPGMRILPSIAAGLLVLACPLTAQVAVEILLDQEQFLRDESLPVKVRVINRSGQTLRLGQDNDWLGLSSRICKGTFCPG
jgi:hypothetical protein